VLVEVSNLKDLPEALAQRWQELQGLTPEFGSPLVGPQFARLVARYRPDAQVAIGYVGDKAIAFFPFHRAKNGYVRAIGAPYCDYQAIVTDPLVRVDGEAFLAGAAIGCVSFTSLMDPYCVFTGEGMASVSGYRIDCKGNGEAYFETLYAANPKWAKNLRRLAKKMDRELGPVRLVGHDQNQASYDAMMAIKVAQFKETGITNVLRPKWVQALMRDLFAMRGGDFGGCMVSLYSGDKFVAGHFGVRQGQWFHPWIASTCPLSHPYSPGIIFLGELTRQSDKIGLQVIDLSEGHGHYKGQFCRKPIQVLAGVKGDRPHVAPSQGKGALALVSRRMDLIEAVEPDFLGQMTAIGMAIASIPRRLTARQGKSENA
jgi:CelD/BcsL family acetyltransferase involved in cellulose biosynthesis